MPSKAPRLLFKQLKGFKAISDDDKIETSAFLIAAREVVALIGEYMIQYFECEPEQTHKDACCVGPSLNFYCFDKYRMKWGRERRGGGGLSEIGHSVKIIDKATQPPQKWILILSALNCLCGAHNDFFWFPALIWCNNQC